MNRYSNLLKSFLMIIVLGVGASAGFASTANISLPGFDNSNSLLAYSTAKPQTFRFKSTQQPVRTERSQPAQNIVDSCFRINQLSKPISVYRNRFCGEVTPAYRNLAGHSSQRIVF